MIGTNLLFDGISFDIHKLSDEKIGAKFVSYLADKIKMTRVDEPRIFKFPVVEGEEISGYTSIILLAESHISIHTWPEKNLFSIDIFSCSSHFDPKKAEQEIIRFFNVKSYKSNIIRRVIPKIEMEIDNSF